ncbi:Helitron helicase [Phytophthora megakarya]|uniref:Helitron helicase n=1 Tax=Phytophthora megakarya TaxID=4795 RepID=A0A225V810_9STRA|nr:Helitron helicase [Phytophthora megakarya]
MARSELSEEQRDVIRRANTVARAVARSEVDDGQREVVQERDATAAKEKRSLLTLDERLEPREEERFRRRPRQYKKGYSYHEDFDPTIVRGKDTMDNRHYISRFLRSGEERPKCGAWKFLEETKKCCCMDGNVKLPPRREAHQKLRLLFSNPVFMKSIRVYNNVSAFTSIGATRSEPLRVDESGTRRGIYNFRVMGTVCHRMGSLLPPPGANPMFAQIYINDPDSAARVSSHIRMTDGLSAEFLVDLDEVMEQYNPYAQQFLHGREILIERSRPALEAVEQNVDNAKQKNTTKMKIDMKRITFSDLDPQWSLQIQAYLSLHLIRSPPVRNLSESTSPHNQEEIENQDADVHERHIDPEVDCELRLHVGHGTNPGTHNTPTASEVAAVIIDANAAQPRDIVLYTRQGGFNRIYETNTHYDPLQYPLLHPYGESGWTYKLPYASEQNSNNDGDNEGRANHGQNDQNIE